MTVLFGISLLLLIHPTAPAEYKWAFHAHTTPAGAPIGRVSGIVSDPEGAIWVATWGEGVHWIQGTEWRTYTEADGLPDDWVRFIANAQDGGVWIATGDGLAHAKDQRITTFSPEKVPAIPELDISYVKEFEDGTLWVGTFGGWVLRHITSPDSTPDYTQSWEVVVRPEDNEGRSVTDIVSYGPDVSLMSFRSQRLAWVRDNDIDQIMPSDRPTWYALFSGTLDGNEVLWAASREGEELFSYKDGVWQPGLPTPPRVSVLTQDTEESTYAATEMGVYALKDQLWQRIDLGVSLGLPVLKSVVFAPDGTIWLGGNEGLIRGAQLAWIPEDVESNPDISLGLLASVTTSEPAVALGGDGKIYRADGDELTHESTLDNWISTDWGPSDHIWLSDGQLWGTQDTDAQWNVVLNNRLHSIAAREYRIFDLDNGGLVHQETLPPNESAIRYFLTWDEELWSIRESGLYRLADGWQPIRPTDPDTMDRVNTILQTGADAFWVGLEKGGIERWVDGHVQRYGLEDGINPENSINTIYEDRSGIIWFGSIGSGIYRFDGEDFQNITKDDGLRSNGVRTIFQSTDGAIWVAYRATGVSVFRHGRWVHYTNVHGLPNAPVLRFAETSEGHFWIGTFDGRVYHYHWDNEPPDTEVSIGPDSVDARGLAVFSVAGHDAWDHTPARDLHYSWRIMPTAPPTDSEATWSPPSLETTMATQGLTPGSYRFEVRSFDEHGNVDLTPATRKFVVAPPLWQKPLFYIPVFFLTMLVLLATAARARSREALRRSEAQLILHRDRLEELVRARTRALEETQHELIEKERLAALGQLTATVSHELRNPLGTIQSSLYTLSKRLEGSELGLEGPLDRMRRSVRRCDHIIEEMLDFTRSPSLERDTVNLDTWLESTLSDIAIPPEVTLLTTLESGATVSMEGESMRRVIINVFDNARQAITEGEREEKNIMITTKCVDEWAIIQVEDTGPGIPPDVLSHIFEPLFSTKNFGVGLGTNIVKNIVERHDGNVTYTNRDEGGARVTVSLPLEFAS